MTTESEPKIRRTSPETLIAQGLGWVDPSTRAVVPPISMATTFIRDWSPGNDRKRVYSRADSPAFEQAEEMVTALEGGAGTLLFGSGMAAATAAFQALDPGDHVIVPKVMYWALRSWLLGFGTRWGLSVEAVDMTDLDAVRAAIRPGKTRMIWAETPSNPLWDVCDIAGLAELSRPYGIRLAVDSTCATPVFTRPIALGADLVMHSATKYLNGHSDVLAGTLTAAAPDAFWTRCIQNRAGGGGVPGTMESWLLARGMRTLFVRVERAAASALAIARHFARHPGIAQVLYPGLPDHPGHALAARQMLGGFGAMLSIRINPMNGLTGEAASLQVARRLRIWKEATSLGSTESLVEHRGSIEGPSSPCPQDLLRLSTGLESPADLIADLEQALASVARSSTQDSA